MLGAVAARRGRCVDGPSPAWLWLHPGRTPRAGFRASSLAGLLLALAPLAAPAGVCLKTQPPRGMPERCHALRITVPPVRPHLVEEVRRWIATCVQRSRADDLVTYDGLETVWSQIGPHRGRTFTLIPTYAPFTFRQDGQRCFGIESIAFRVAEHRVGKVREGDPSDFTVGKGARQDQLEAAARRAIPLVRTGQVSGTAKSRLLCVLGHIAKFGESHDTRFYDVGPQARTNTAEHELPFACFTRSTTRAGGSTPVCKSIAASTIDCTVSFGDRLVSAGLRDDAQFVAALASLDEKIVRGLKYTQGLTLLGKGVMGCPFLHQVVIPAQKASRKRLDLYSCY